VLLSYLRPSGRGARIAENTVTAKGWLGYPPKTRQAGSRPACRVWAAHLLWAKLRVEHHEDAPVL